MADTYVALLRGVNVGGNNLLPMKDLADLFSRAGCSAVRTFIQSGNVIFSAAPGIALGIPNTLPQLIEKRFGFRPPVVLRSLNAMEQVYSNNPYPAVEGPEERLYVLFLAERPSAAAVKKLDPDRSPPDIYAVRGAEIYLRFRSVGAVSKLTNAYFDSKLATVSTMRNWRTVGKLVELMRASALAQG